MRPTEAKDDLLQVRFERAEKRRFAELARQRGLTLSDLVRQSLKLAERAAA